MRLQYTKKPFLVFYIFICNSDKQFTNSVALLGLQENIFSPSNLRLMESIYLILLFKYLIFSVSQNHLAFLSLILIFPLQTLLVRKGADWPRH